jgi:hypothetical protein
MTKLLYSGPAIAASAATATTRRVTAGKSAGFAGARKQLTAVTRQFGRASGDGRERPENPSVTGRPLVSGPLIIERRGLWLVTLWK